MSDSTDTKSEAASGPSRRVFGHVPYPKDSDSRAAAALVPLIYFVLAGGAWLLVGAFSGCLALFACLFLTAAIWLVRPVVFRVLLALVIAFAPLPVVISQIAFNSQMAAQAEDAKQAAEKPYNDAVAAAKDDLKKQGFWVDTLSLNRDDMTRGDASLYYHSQAGSSYAKVILIQKDGRWTVNCSTPSGLVDINANNYQLGKLLYEFGQCPAGYAPSVAPTP